MLEIGTVFERNGESWDSDSSGGTCARDSFTSCHFWLVLREVTSLTKTVEHIK